MRDGGRAYRYYTFLCYFGLQFWGLNIVTIRDLSLDIYDSNKINVIVITKYCFYFQESTFHYFHHLHMNPNAKVDISSLLT